MGSGTSANLTNAGLGTWYWDVEARNSSNQTIGASETRTFIVNTTGQPAKMPISPMQMDWFLDSDELWDDGFDDMDSSGLTEKAGQSLLVVQDEEENVLSPIQEQRVEGSDNTPGGTVGIRMMILDNGLNQDIDDDLFDLWFGEFDE
jgi:hypothetical protein